MKLVSRKPKEPLAKAIELLWYCGECKPLHAKERVLPSGTVQLIVDLGPAANQPSTPLVCGPHSIGAVIDTKSQSSKLGVHFKPGGAAAFLAAPVDELHNTHVPLDAFWGSKAGELHDRLLDARSPDERFEIIERSLLLHAESARNKRHPAVALALREFERVPHEATISDVSELCGLSARRFIQLFRREVGLTPKLHCRIRRFQAALSWMSQRQSVDWAQLAVSCGYYDQPHFNNEFRAFSGLSPTDYLRQRNQHFNHVAILD